MSKLAIVSGAEGAYVSLSRSKQGRIFKKHILSVGELLYPGIKGGKVDIDESFLNTLKNNFEGTAVPIVQFPLAGPNNEHSEAPDRNIGEVVDLSVENGKMYAHIDVRKHTEDIGSTILGASAMFSLNYTDTSTGQKIGPALLHVAATNRPYVTALDDYEEIIAASADSTDDEAVVLTAKEKEMTLEEILAALKADHNIDVEGLQAKLAETEAKLTESEGKATEGETKASDAEAELEAVKTERDEAKTEAETARTEADEAKQASVELSSAILDKLDGLDVVKLSNAETGPTAEELISGVAQLATEKVELSNKVETLSAESVKKDADHRIEGLIADGFILEKDKDAQTELLLSNPSLFDKLVPETPIVKLGNEHGFEIKEFGHDVEVEAEFARISEVAATRGISLK